MSNSKPNVFLLNLIIGENLPGALTCSLDLGVSPIGNNVQGRSVVFQPINPPIHVESIVTGPYYYMCTNNDCHIRIDLNGYQDTGDGCLKNFEATIVLKDDWKSGTANYTFLRNGEWVTMSDQKVKLVENDGINDLSKLAETVKLAKA